MKIVSKENIETNKFELEIRVEADAFENAIQNTFRKKAKNITLPGFRRGKAPRKMIEKMYGESYFYEDAINATYSQALSDAVKEAELDVVTPPTVEITEVNKEDGYLMKAVCIVKPEVELKDYSGIKIEKVVKNVTDEDIEKELLQMQERNARMLSVEDRPAQNGDTVVFDFEGFADGVAFEGGKAEGHSLVLGSGSFIPGFEEQIVGHSIEDAFDVNVTFPEDYQAENLKGKEAVFKCKIHNITAKELPALDDEFAKDVSEFDTLDELKADIRSKQEKTNSDNADKQAEKDLLDKVIENMSGEIPQEMYDARVNDLVHDFEHRMQHQGLTMDQYLQYTGMNMDSFKEQFKEQAESQVKVSLALEKISALENIEATEDDLEAEFKKYAENYKMEVEEIKKAIPVEDLKADIRSTKALDFLKASAVITEVEEKLEEEKKEEKKPAEKKIAAKKKTTKKADDDEEKLKTAKKTAAKKTTTRKKTTKAKDEGKDTE